MAVIGTANGSVLDHCGYPHSRFRHTSPIDPRPRLFQPTTLRGGGSVGWGKSHFYTGIIPGSDFPPGRVVFSTDESRRTLRPDPEDRDWHGKNLTRTVERSIPFEPRRGGLSLTEECIMREEQIESTEFEGRGDRGGEGTPATNHKPCKELRCEVRPGKIRRGTEEP